MYLLVLYLWGFINYHWNDSPKLCSNLTLSKEDKVTSKDEIGTVLGSIAFVLVIILLMILTRSFLQKKCQTTPEEPPDTSEAPVLNAIRFRNPPGRLERLQNYFQNCFTNTWTFPSAYLMHNLCSIISLVGSWLDEQQVQESVWTFHKTKKLLWKMFLKIYWSWLRIVRIHFTRNRLSPKIEKVFINCFCR